mgnify:CR=1 FL=1
MPNRPSSLRDLRRSRRHSQRNRLVREQLSYLLRQSRQRIAKGDAAARTAVVAVTRALDRAVRAGVVKAGTAARYKSRLMRRINRLGPSTSSAQR